jgi:hypothetical protein
VVINLEEAWKNHKIRGEVINLLVQAEQSALPLVAANVTYGRPLDFSGGQTETDILNRFVSISTTTGIITVSIESNFQSTMKNLKLVPINNNSIVKVTNGMVAKDVDWEKVKWICTSADSKNSFNLPQEGRGSLDSRFAPAHCR